MTLNYGNYGISLIMGNAGFISSTVGVFSSPAWSCPWSLMGLSLATARVRRPRTRTRRNPRSDRRIQEADAARDVQDHRCGMWGRLMFMLTGLMQGIT